MFKAHVHPTDLPMLSDEVALCQRVFDIVRGEAGIEHGDTKEDMLAASIIQFYKQGIHNEQQLLILARTSAIS